METTHPHSEVLIPDRVIDDRSDPLFTNKRDPVRGRELRVSWRQKFAATLPLSVRPVERNVDGEAVSFKAAFE